MALKNRLQTATAIPTEVFLDRFLKIWSPPPWLAAAKVANYRIGLAISGGVDSLALAGLCARVQKQTWEYQGHSLKFNFQAFVVDHGVRRGSNDEARRVAKLLNKLGGFLRSTKGAILIIRGLSSHVLKMQWPDNIDPHSSTKFETMARQMRYQLLGKACRDQGTNSLLLAHHSDDQYETVLMRLQQMHRGVGLRGVRAAANIPECHGIYGVDQSGLDYMAPRVLRPLGELAPFRTDQHQPKIKSWTLVSETGGVRVYRPLLEFDKADLAATCVEMKIRPFEDVTNADPTITTRNAIRHIYKNYELPRALQKSSILQLAQFFQENNEFMSSQADKLFANLALKEFWPASGSLVVDFGRVSHKIPYWEQIAVKLVERVADLVSPQHSSDIGQEKVLGEIFPDLTTYSFQHGKPKAKSFTSSSVMFKPVRVEHEIIDGELVRTENTWRVSRRPLSKREAETCHLRFPSQPAGQAEFSDWKLFDGRFWIRIKNCIGRELKLRLLQREDKALVRGMVCLNDRNVKADKMFTMAAPDVVRWTMPVLAIDSSENTEQVIAMPTLALADKRLREGEIEWEVRYKYVDLGPHAARHRATIKTLSTTAPDRPQQRFELEEQQQQSEATAAPTMDARIRPDDELIQQLRNARAETGEIKTYSLAKSPRRARSGTQQAKH